MGKLEKVNAFSTGNGFEEDKPYENFQELFLDLLKKIMCVFSFQVPLAVIVFIIWFIVRVDRW